MCIRDSPKQVPLVRLSICKTIGFAQTAHELGVALQDLVEQLTVIDVVSALPLVMSIRRRWRRVHQKLRSLDTLEIYVFVYSALRLGHMDVLEERSLRDVKGPILVEEILGSTRLSVVGTRDQQRDVVIFHVSEEAKKSVK